MRLARLVSKLVLAVLMVLGSAFAVAFVVVLVVAQLDQRVKSDAIVVLGAAQYNGRPSPVLRARLDHALALWQEGLAPRIIVTGGVGRGDTTSEALVGRRYLLARQLPDSAVVVAGQNRTTEASMTEVGQWLRTRGLRTVLLVSDPFHMARLRVEADRTELVAHTSPTDTSPISDNPGLELRYLFLEAAKLPVAWWRAIAG